MNLPNKLTLMRVILVPFFVAAALIDFPYHYFVALAIFIIASVTDFFDGYLARKHNLVTNFGKFLDPLADKVLVVAALVCLHETLPAVVGAIPVIIIVSREFMVSGLRLVTAGEGVVVPADIWGKLKTAFTMVTIIATYTFSGIYAEQLSAASVGMNIVPTTKAMSVFMTVLIVFVWISTALTVVSGVRYLWQMRKHIDPTK
ncbi:MAG: CDP-diacylglycerol--glycerol-3-phosphate 3-phosphatidyltransferase [Ruminococcus sp.]|nr:CDP-diacylglycerol--glycerol-3-phosphate 3-phosphatidyltransferase [Ruminococcus sp.]